MDCASLVPGGSAALYLGVPHRQAVAKLPEKQRQVFILRYYDEMPYEQMSEVLDTSVGALKASFHIAQEKVRASLGKDFFVGSD